MKTSSLEPDAYASQLRIDSNFRLMSVALQSVSNSTRFSGLYERFLLLFNRIIMQCRSSWVVEFALRRH